MGGLFRRCSYVCSHDENSFSKNYATARLCAGSLASASIPAALASGRATIVGLTTIDLILLLAGAFFAGLVDAVVGGGGL
ncbi:MAG: hypothetical protein ACOYYF_06475, partial [Chloroflexota bacterium]